MKKDCGITLIALVISIVVLIILAGVAINTLINNGIIDKAKTATQEYKNAQDYEETQIAKYTNDINNYVNSNRDYTPISYSTDEQDTGLKWIDGKSIFQKTFNIKLPSISSAVSADLPTNLDNVINICGWCLNVNNDFLVMNPTYSNDITLYYRKNSRDLYVLYLNNATHAHNCDAYVTIQYTKTLSGTNE